jgi:cation diffusion facilitator family transporter
MAADARSRDQKVIRISAAILVANLCVAFAKLAYGLSLGSIAIEADGFHSLLDGVNNVVIILAVSVAGRPADAGHPYGHRKFEVLASLFIGFMFAVLILRTGADAITALVSGEQKQIASEAYVVVLATIGVNIAVTALEHAYGKRLQSAALIADARHTLSDVLVSLTVLAGVFASRSGLHGADAIAALIVVGVIAWVGWGIVRSAISGLADEAGLAAETLREHAGAVEGVRGVKNVRSRKYGGDVKVDLVITVDGHLSVFAAHAIADAVEAALMTRFPQVSDVIVHVEPVRG